MQRDDGEGNFKQNNSAHTLFLDSIVYSLNNVYSNIEAPASAPSQNCTTSHIIDSKIRFSLEGIYYHKDSYGWNCNYYTKGYCGNFERCPYKPEPGDTLHYLVENHPENINN